MAAIFIVYICALIGVLILAGLILWDSRPRRPPLSRPTPLKPLSDPKGTHHSTGAKRGE